LNRQLDPETGYSFSQAWAVNAVLYLHVHLWIKHDWQSLTQTLSTV